LPVPDIISNSCLAAETSSELIELLTTYSKYFLATPAFPKFL